MTVSGSGSFSGAATLAKTTVGVATLVTSGVPNPGAPAASAFSFTVIFLDAFGVQDATAVFTAGTSSVPGVATVTVTDHHDGTATVACTFVGIGATFIDLSATSSLPATAALRYRLGASALWASQGHQNFTITAVNASTNTLSVAGDQTHFFPVGTHPQDTTTIANYTVASVVYNAGPNTTDVTMAGSWTAGAVNDALHSSVINVNPTIRAVNTGTNTFTVNTDRHLQYPMGSSPSVRSTITYTVSSAAYDSINNVTNVTMTGSYVGGLVGDTLKADNFAYDLGTRVWIPSPPPPLDPPLVKPPGAFDVTTYGADPTGVLDSGPAFVNAIDAAQAVSGSAVWIPDGEYSIDTYPSGTNQTGIQIPSRTSSAAITIIGTGRDRVFIRQRGSMGHLMTDISGGVTLRDFTVDTATTPMSAYDAYGLNATGVATNGSGCTNKGLGSLGGTTYCYRFVGGGETSHASGNSADDIYIDSGSQLLNNSGDIDYQDNWVGTRFNFWGGMINPFFFNGLDWRHVTYHNNGRDNSGGQFVTLTHALGTIVLQDFQDFGGTGSVSLLCPQSSATFQGTATITVDGYVQHNSAGKFVIGDVVSPGSIDVKNSTFWNVDLQPYVDVVGTWEGSNVVNGSATCHAQQAGGHSHLTGFPGPQC